MTLYDPEQLHLNQNSYEDAKNVCVRFADYTMEHVFGKQSRKNLVHTVTFRHDNKLLSEVCFEIHVRPAGYMPVSNDTECYMSLKYKRDDKQFHRRYFRQGDPLTNPGAFTLKLASHENCEAATTMVNTIIYKLNNPLLWKPTVLNSWFRIKN